MHEADTVGFRACDVCEVPIARDRGGREVGQVEETDGAAGAPLPTLADVSN